MSKKNPQRITNWILACIYFILVLFIIDIAFLHHFFPYVYEYIEKENQVYLKDGVEQIVWGPYEIQPNQLNHDTELAIVLYSNGVSSSIYLLLLFLMPIPYKIKEVIERPNAWNKVTLIVSSVLVIYFGYHYINNLLYLLPYLDL